MTEFSYERRVLSGGYVQHREAACQTAWRGPWKFQITGFDDTGAGQCGKCTILMADGSRQQIPIDGENRITVNGRKYPETQWHH